ncbi:patatin-like phospholipase family protein [Sulfurospirillum sp. 1307]
MENHRVTTKPTLEVCLALSGGAARGSFHLGFIDALQKNGVVIKAISGSSAGALVGGAISCGISPRQTLKIFKSKEFKKIFKFTWFSKGLFKIDLEAKILDKLFLYDDLSQTKIPFFACVTDLDTQKALYFNEGPAKELICASCALVPFFSPIIYDEKVLVDGGILDLMPVAPLKSFDEKILGINIMPSIAYKKNSLKIVIMKLLSILTSANLQKSIKMCDFYVAPKEILKYKMFSFKSLQKGFDLGYEYGQKWCEEHVNSHISSH